MTRYQHLRVRCGRMTHFETPEANSRRVVKNTLVRFCQDDGIAVEGYTAIARFDDRLMRLPRLKSIATAHNKTSAQVVLRWHVQNGIIPVVRSLNPSRQFENFNIFDFELTSEEMRIIDSFNINARIRYDPDNCDFTVL